MSVKTIFAPFADSSDTPAVRMALAVARDLEAHVDAVYVEPTPRAVPAAARAPAMSAVGVGTYDAGIAGAGRPAMPDPILEATRSRDQAAMTAKVRFEQHSQACGVRVLDRQKPRHEKPGHEKPGYDKRGMNGDHPLPSASYRREIGSMAQIIGDYAHAYDVIVAESASVAKDGKAAREAIDTALLRSGRPVLLAPVHPPEHLDGRILVAWDDSPQCWHALSTALPFMSKAKEVVLFHAGKENRSERQAEEKAADYLAWHGIRADVAQHEPGPVGIADYLMSQCTDRQVGLMVMGAYSHSPLRERILGGVTLSMLTRVAATPVLMMH